MPAGCELGNSAAPVAGYKCARILFIDAVKGQADRRDLGSFPPGIGRNRVRELRLHNVHHARVSAYIISINRGSLIRVVNSRLRCSKAASDCFFFCP